MAPFCLFVVCQIQEGANVGFPVSGSQLKKLSSTKLLHTRCLMPESTEHIEECSKDLAILDNKLHLQGGKKKKTEMLENLLSVFFPRFLRIMARS